MKRFSNPSSHVGHLARRQVIERNDEKVDARTKNINIHLEINVSVMNSCSHVSSATTSFWQCTNRMSGRRPPTCTHPPAPMSNVDRRHMRRACIFIASPNQQASSCEDTPDCLDEICTCMLYVYMHKYGVAVTVNLALPFWLDLGSISNVRSASELSPYNNIEHPVASRAEGRKLLLHCKLYCTPREQSCKAMMELILL